MRRGIQIFGLALLAVACSQSTVADSSKGVEWFKVAATAYVTEITLPSGVRCVLYDDYQSGGIDCDWTSR